MTGLTGGPDRRQDGVDRDINTARRARDRCLLQIDEYLGAVTSLRRKFARLGRDIDVLLDERLALLAAVLIPPTPEGLDADSPSTRPIPRDPHPGDVGSGDPSGHHG